MSPFSRKKVYGGETGFSKKGLSSLNCGRLGTMPLKRSAAIHVVGMSLIHAAANFASFFAFRALSIKERTFCFIVWK
jgi:hypothetical protein